MPPVCLPGEKALLRAKAKKKLKSKVREKGTAKPARKLSVPELLHKVRQQCSDLLLTCLELNPIPQ